MTDLNGSLTVTGTTAPILGGTSQLTSKFTETQQNNLKELNFGSLVEGFPYQNVFTSGGTVGVAGSGDIALGSGAVTFGGAVPNTIQGLVQLYLGQVT